ncbi:MAG TPA: hypothetical protein VLJ19_14180 [Variovorax sp.]|nr:hypothetical protein [Variovorax sp.]
MEAPHKSSYYLVWPRRNHGNYEVQIFLQWLKSKVSTYLAEWQRAL